MQRAAARKQAARTEEGNKDAAEKCNTTGSAVIIVYSPPIGDSFLGFSISCFVNVGLKTFPASAFVPSWLVSSQNTG